MAIKVIFEIKREQILAADIFLEYSPLVSNIFPNYRLIVINQVSP